MLVNILVYKAIKIILQDKNANGQTVEIAGVNGT